MVNFGANRISNSVKYRNIKLDTKRYSPLNTHKIVKVIFYKSIFLFALLLSFNARCNDSFSGTLRLLDNTKIVLGQIKIEGNKKTKDKLILRELDITMGDTLSVSDTNEIFTRNENKIFNTSLFVTVDFYTKLNEAGTHSLTIKVKERWYIFPIPILELADRNFNEWWHDRGHQLNRVEYGIRFKHENFRGRNEKLKIVLQHGFTRKYELFYALPYVSKKMKEGLQFGISYSTNKAVAYQTDDHKLTFYSSEQLLRKRFYTNVAFTKRNKFYGTHDTELFFHHNIVHDSIALLNPDYFLDGNTEQKYFRWLYRYSYDKRNIQYYPTKGRMIKGEIERTGLGIFNDASVTTLLGTYAQYWELTPKWFAATKVDGKVSLPSKQPYFNQRGLGYKEVLVRGYELNVIDGQHYFLHKASLRRRILAIRKTFKTLIPVDEFKTVPYAFYLKIHNDWGYVADNTNNPLNERLSNQILWGAGIGIDFVTYYDSVVRMEYSINNYGRGGLFFHFVTDI